jgi:hypothetical protein
VVQPACLTQTAGRKLTIERFLTDIGEFGELAVEVRTDYWLKRTAHKQKVVKPLEESFQVIAEQVRYLLFQVCIHLANYTCTTPNPVLISRTDRYMCLVLEHVR